MVYHGSPRSSCQSSAQETPVADSQLTIVERQADDVTILILTGSILLDDGDLAFGRLIRDLIDRGRVMIVVDLGGVTHIDSSGTGMLVAKLKSVREKGGDIRLLHVTMRGQRLLSVMKILTIFEIFDDEAAAVRSFTARPHG
jgi:anti-sigma B factor antagonist